MKREELLTKRARALRNAPPEPEMVLWNHLSRSQQFRRQAVMAPFIVDFFCPAKGLIVEIDGDTHVAGVDARRDALLLTKGFQTIRFTNIDVMESLEGVLDRILATLVSLPDRWPHPNPSPEGEGLQVAPKAPPLQECDSVWPCPGDRAAVALGWGGGVVAINESARDRK